MLRSADAARLTALVQNSQGSDDGDDDMSVGAPAAAVYESHSGNIIDTLNGLQDEAQTKLAEARKDDVYAP